MNPQLFSVEGRVAWVTGASSGIGQALATALAEAGAAVLGIARRADALAEWSDRIAGTTAVLAADLSGPDNAANVAAQGRAALGPPQILINAAGVNTRQAADDVTLDGWRQTIDLNLAVPFFLAQAVVPDMRVAGWGRILNIASLQSERAFPGGLAYGASKGGITQLTRAMAEAWSADGITANAIAPGFFPTELTGPVFSDNERSAQNAAQTCIGRNGELSDLIGPAMFFCSEAGAYVTGQTLFVDGGFTAK
ncbi:MAG: SDR family oxidoreductase [Pseudomonadota bacterium]